MIFDLLCLIVIVTVVAAGWHHAITEIREDDRKRRNERAMARAMGGRCDDSSEYSPAAQFHEERGDID